MGCRRSAPRDAGRSCAVPGGTLYDPCADGPTRTRRRPVRRDRRARAGRHRRTLADGRGGWGPRTRAVGGSGTGDTVYVAYNSGALTALDADDGSVRWHTELEVDGAPTTALSLTVAPQGHLLIGTTDGRILECASPA
ncbi:PQQ-binding-like beta-propeller repeat protein [Streptomyces sp. NPDC058595]|uniref:outer membrane protein assembly factor BamB family protein n=1 Tax=Streptomyces sp. NPDC058595 TaxID=3346550 RepID=UPI0036653A08